MIDTQLILIIFSMWIFFMFIDFSDQKVESYDVIQINTSTPTPTCGTDHNCGNYNQEQCKGCQNCGYCIDSARNGQCVPGDENGPFIESDCSTYQYQQNPVIGSTPQPTANIQYTEYCHVCNAIQNEIQCNNCYNCAFNNTNKSCVDSAYI